MQIADSEIVLIRVSVWERNSQTNKIKFCYFFPVLIVLMNAVLVASSMS